MKVFDVNDNNVNKFNNLVMKGGQRTIVKYYADWCGHCKELNRKWPKIVNNVRKSKGNGILASVPEHMIHKVQCDNSIQGYPTLKYIVSGVQKGPDYNGIREVKELSRYIKKKLTRCKKNTRRLRKSKGRKSTGTRRKSTGTRRKSRGNRRKSMGNRRKSMGNRRKSMGNRRKSKGHRKKLKSNSRKKH
jgi:thioredoxin-like negative regulator of GroEL